MGQIQSKPVSRVLFPLRGGSHLSGTTVTCRL